VSSYLRLITYPDWKICCIYCSYIVDVENIHRPIFCIQSSWTSDQIFSQYNSTIKTIPNQKLFDHAPCKDIRKCDDTSITCAYIFQCKLDCIKYLWYL
jgi:hypothetical protein